MGTEIPRASNTSRAIYGLTLLTVVLVWAIGAGCDQPLGPNETYHRLSTAWPIFDVEKSEGIDENGIRWKKEKGDAVCWLATWEKEQKFDKENFLVYRKERNTFFPLYSTEIEETEEFIHKWGSVLIYPYRSNRLKSAEQVPIAQPTQ